MIKLVTIYDNIEFHEQFKTDWGFGCIIDHPRGKILFDTGAKSEILEANLKMASILPESIDTIIISHKHSDHHGGALWLAQQNSNVKIYIPKTWNKTLEKQLSEWTPNIHPINSNFLITKGLHLIMTKNFWIKELSLAIETSQGLLLVSGCSHTGIDHIVLKTIEETGLDILALFGGFHLFRSSNKKISNIINNLKQMHVKTIAPCHCTGEHATRIVETEFGKNFLLNGAGAQFVFEE